MPVKRKKVFALISVVLITTAVMIWYFNFSTFKIRENISVECVYIRYACGDCYPRYNVKAVSPNLLKKKLIGKDIDIEFSNKKDENAFRKQIGICDECYNYSLKGDLYYSEKKDCHVLKVKKYKLTLWSNECCH